MPAQHRDGVSFLPALEDPAASPGERPLFWHYPHWGNQGGTPGAAVRRGDWKLIDWYWGKDQELFNLAADPGEETNLAADHPEKVVELRRLLDTFRGDTAAVMPAPNPHPRQPFDAW